MRIAEYKQISTQQEQRVRDVPASFDENGVLISEACTETYTVEIPVMGTVYRDATQAEIEAYEAFEEEIAENAPHPQSDTDRILELEAALEALLRGETA